MSERDDLFSLSRCCFYISSFVVETRWLVLFVRTRSRFSELVQSAIIFFCGVRVACVCGCVLFARKLKKGPQQRKTIQVTQVIKRGKRGCRKGQRAKGIILQKKERERGNASSALFFLAKNTLNNERNKRSGWFCFFAQLANVE